MIRTHRLPGPLFPPVLAAFVASIAAVASAGEPTPKVEKAYPTRIEVGSVLEVLGQRFDRLGRTAKLRYEGTLVLTGKKLGFERDVRVESPRRVAYRVTAKDWRELGEPRGAARGKLSLLTKDGRVVGSLAVQWRLFPINILAAEELSKKDASPRPFLAWALAALVALLVAATAGGLGRFRGFSKEASLALAMVGLLAVVVPMLIWQGPVAAALGRFAALPYLLPLGIALLVAAFFVVVALLYAGPLTWVERRVAARMQSRVGPNRVGPQGLIQWLADGIKGVTKEDIIPTNADEKLFRMAPYLAFSPVFATFAVLPLSANWTATDLDVGLLFAVSITSIVVPGLLMAGWSSNNKWSLFGGMRAAAQIVSYEVPATLALLTVIVGAGSLSLQELIRSQGGAPWNWGIFQSPFTFVAFFLFFTSALAEGNRAPFDLPEAESELVSGYNTEYSGMRFLLFFVAEYVNIYVMSALAACVFLGGWRVPLISVAEQEVSTLWQAVGMVLFLGKVSALSFVVIWLRWTLPRPRVDQLMVLCWKYFLPFGLACFLGAAVWVLSVDHAPALARLLRLGMFGLGAGLVGFVLYRAYWHFKHTHAKLYLHIVDR